ncbi:hypothetical protein BRD13_03975 [Halobacteriales archaeon SW_5_70_135]|nr:MAG: hypothetical protein BRD13_03975 [Halobacteriales archaeon SW_5_70_135]
MTDAADIPGEDVLTLGELTEELAEATDTTTERIASKPPRHVRRPSEGADLAELYAAVCFAVDGS